VPCCERRESGLALFEACDSIDLMAIQDVAAVDAPVKKVGGGQGYGRPHPCRAKPRVSSQGEDRKVSRQEASGDDRDAFEQSRRRPRANGGNLIPPIPAENRYANPAAKFSARSLAPW
jgi:hypothetical protein